MKREVLLLVLIGFILVFILTFSFVGLSPEKRSPQTPVVAQRVEKSAVDSGSFVFIGGKKIRVDLANTPATRTQGLSGRKSLLENQGMLFVFDDSDFHSFWMKNMKFPIDIIYIKGDKVTTVIENAKPSTTSDENLEIFQPNEASDKVLEVNAGIAKKYNIKKGTVIKTGSL
jgi:uncharacterized membrane protein (UPF0127 family)